MSATSRQRERNRRRQQQTVLLAGGLALAFLLPLMAIGGYLLLRGGRASTPGAMTQGPLAMGETTSPVSVRSKVTRVSATTEGEAWNHKELFDHLAGAGVGVDFGPRSRWGGVWFVDAAEDVLVNHHDIAVSERCVSVERHPTPQAAHDAAGRAGGRGWSWGRFSFTATQDGVGLLARIKAALG